MKKNINPIVLLKRVIFTLAITLSSFQGIAGDKPEKDENNLSSYNTQLKEIPSPSQGNKTSSYEFEPFSRKTKLTLPGLNVSFPFLKPLLSGTSGILSFTTLPVPYNCIIGLPLMGLATGTHLVPQCKTTMGKMLLGTSIAGITVLATIKTAAIGSALCLDAFWNHPHTWRWSRWPIHVHPLNRFLVTYSLFYAVPLLYGAKSDFEPVFVLHENENE